MLRQREPICPERGGALTSRPHQCQEAGRTSRLSLLPPLTLSIDSHPLGRAVATRLMCEFSASWLIKSLILLSTAVDETNKTESRTETLPLAPHKSQPSRRQLWCRSLLQGWHNLGHHGRPFGRHDPSVSFQAGYVISSSASLDGG